MGLGGGQQACRRFVERFIAQAENFRNASAPGSSPQFLERLDGLLRIHVNLTAGRRVVPADGKQRDINRISLTDFLEPVENKRCRHNEK